MFLACVFSVLHFNFECLMSSKVRSIKHIQLIINEHVRIQIELFVSIIEKNQENIFI